MDVQILYIPSRCFKSHAFYSQAILKIRIDRSCAHLTWKIENGVEMSTISIYGYFRVVLSSLRLMWNIEKPRTHSHTRTCSILIVPMALRFANVSWLDHSSFFAIFAFEAHGMCHHEFIIFCSKLFMERNFLFPQFWIIFGENGQKIIPSS